MVGYYEAANRAQEKAESDYVALEKRVGDAVAEIDRLRAQLEKLVLDRAAGRREVIEAIERHANLLWLAATKSGDAHEKFASGAFDACAKALRAEFLPKEPA